MSVSDDMCLKKKKKVWDPARLALEDLSQIFMRKRDKNFWFWHFVLEPVLSSEEGRGETSNVESRQKRLG